MIHRSSLFVIWLNEGGIDALKDKIELFFLSPYSSDLNQIERIWWFLRKKLQTTGKL
ncbi:MAG: hypothetical protein EAZ27_02450 [Cytophagales bacterium]|nr:MAG: hypothetical protein EAZ27_02450 [Cytophagales bacterium]